MTPDAMRTALARAGLYRLLSLGFTYPEAGVHEEFGRVLGLHLLEAHPEGPVRDALQALAEASAEDLAEAYLQLFDRQVVCSPYESEYGSGDKSFTKSRDLADIAGFYKAFGLDLKEGAAEPCDHIRIELEFMSVLALKEAYFLESGDREGLEVTIEAQQSFLKAHLGRWAPFFCERLIEASGSYFYGALAAATSAVVLADLTELQVEPIPLFTGPVLPPQPLEEGMTCPMA